MVCRLIRPPALCTGHIIDEDTLAALLNVSGELKIMEKPCDQMVFHCSGLQNTS